MIKFARIAGKKTDWDVRFPKHDEPLDSEVVTYTMTQEEIIEKYGPSLLMKLPQEQLNEYRKKGYSVEKISRLTGLSTREVRHVRNHYNKVKVNKNLDDHITKGEFVALRDNGYTLSEIAHVAGISNASLYQRRRDWGILGDEQIGKVARQ